MPKNNASFSWVVLGSLLVGMVLRIVPLPNEWFVYNPDWLLLFLMYWAISVPERVGVGYAWCIGLLGDALTGRMLGQHALAYSVVVFLCVKLHSRLRSYPLYQQALMILLLLLVNQGLIFLTQKTKTDTAIGLVYWLPSLVGSFVWPVVLLMLSRVRRHYHIA